jgi:hypothetical protein
MVAVVKVRSLKVVKPVPVALVPVAVVTPMLESVPPPAV